MTNSFKSSSAGKKKAPPTPRKSPTIGRARTRVPETDAVAPDTTHEPVLTYLGPSPAGAQTGPAKSKFGFLPRALKPKSTKASSSSSGTDTDSSPYALLPMPSANSTGSRYLKSRSDKVRLPILRRRATPVTTQPALIVSPPRPATGTPAKSGTVTPDTPPATSGTRTAQDSPPTDSGTGTPPRAAAVSPPERPVYGKEPEIPNMISMLKAIGTARSVWREDAEDSSTGAKLKETKAALETCYTWFNTRQVESWDKIHPLQTATHAYTREAMAEFERRHGELVANMARTSKDAPMGFPTTSPPRRSQRPPNSGRGSPRIRRPWTSWDPRPIGIQRSAGWSACWRRVTGSGLSTG